jgi:arylsulfatase A
MKYSSKLLFLACISVNALIFAKENRPNIILIMADDMGYEALSSNGSESCKSPNLDKLAE